MPLIPSRPAAYLTFLAAITSLAISPCLSAQTPSSDSAPMPSDANALLLLAAQQNGLTGAKLQPWHLKATYSAMDEQGKVTDQGTIEQFWASPERSKIILTSGSDTQTVFITPGGNLQAGSLKGKSINATFLRAELVEPLLDPDFIQQNHFGMEERSVGTTKLECLGIDSEIKKKSQASANLTFCLAPDKPILRIASVGAGMRQMIHNGIFKFQTQYVAKDITGLVNGKKEMLAHIETIEPLQVLDDSLFAPSTDAKAITDKIAISSGMATGYLLQKVNPAYPLAAKQGRVQGKVVLQGVIGTNGHVIELKAVSGPNLLQQEALDAVKQWLYRPSEFNGKPIEVETTVNVIFNLGG
jgi:TonB family protein